MFERGARKFVFLSRSGTDRIPAKDHIESLERSGAEVIVSRGNVSEFEDVKRTIGQIRHPIGGVVQAAMGLDVRSPILHKISSDTDII